MHLPRSARSEWEGLGRASEVPRRILLLNWRDILNPAAGGAEMHIWSAFKPLVARGIQVDLIAARFRGCKRTEVVDGIRVHRIGNDLNYHLVVPFAYANIARKTNPDLVVEFLNKLPLYGPLFIRRPHVGFVHHLFGDSAHHELQEPLATIVQSWEHFIPRAYANTPMLAGSESALRELARLGLRSENLHHVPYGTQTEKYFPGTKTEHPSVLYLGRVRAYKGVDHLLKVLPSLRAKYPRLRVSIAGVGDAVPGLKQLAQDLGLTDCVEFLGFVSEEQKCQLYRESWLMAFPSSKEGFGLTVPESALSGTPTVGYDVPGLCDSVEDGKTGLLVPYGDLDALERSVSLVLHDTRYRAQLSAAARASYENFTWERSAEILGMTLDTCYRSIAYGKSHQAISQGAMESGDQSATMRIRP